MADPIRDASGATRRSHHGRSATTSRSYRSRDRTLARTASSLGWGGNSQGSKMNISRLNTAIPVRIELRRTVSIA
jgi:hypothetical protein